jgi:DNA-binding IclR family transcriptional regulator
LRLIARGKADGVRLTNLSRVSDLPYSTLCRIVQCLCEEGMIARDPKSGRYRLGQLSYELGLATRDDFDFRRDLRPTLEKIAHLTGERVHLIGKSRGDCVCLDVVDDRVDDRIVTLDIGGRRPACFIAGGLSILSQLDDSLLATELAYNMSDIRNHASMTRTRIMRSIDAARERGYSVARDTSVIGLSAVGVYLPASDARPPLSVSLGMRSERLSLSRAAEMASIMKEALSL